MTIADGIDVHLSLPPVLDGCPDRRKMERQERQKSKKVVGLRASFDLALWSAQAIICGPFPAVRYVSEATGFPEEAKEEGKERRDKIKIKSPSI